MKKLNIAVIGLGNMGRHHVRVYSENPDVNLVAVCDSNPTLRAQFEETYAVKGYSDYKLLIDEQNLDALSIVASTRLHYEMAKYAIEKGVNVLVEKPIADTIERADDLIRLAKQHNVKLMVGHIERFNPSVQVVDQLIKAGEVGRVVSISTRRLGGFPGQIKDANVLIDLAVHDIDIIHTLIGESSPTQILINSGRAVADDRDDYADILLRYSIVSAYVQVNWITPNRIRTLTVTGNEGYIQMDYIAQTVTLFKSKVTKTVSLTGEVTIGLPVSEPISIEVPKKEPLASELGHFITCIQTNSSPLVTGENGRDALAIALSR